MLPVLSPSNPQQIGKYEVLGLIGRGGMGMVYSARDPFIDRIVAIKTIRIGHDETDEDNQRDRLRMEARSAGKLQHPNVVTIYEYGEQDDLSYIVMEFVEGANLSRVIQKAMLLPLATRIGMLVQIARGLGYAHECGVIHRDLKPSNVCITRRGVPKILDFGLARFDDTKLTRTGYLSGTIAYMSPERFSGQTGPQDDIFALGAMAYEFLTFRRAFPGETTPEVISKILSGPMPQNVSELTGYPPALDDIVLRAIARDPADRYATATDFEQALLEFTHSKGYLEHAAQEARQPELRAPAVWTDDEAAAGTNPYSSARSMPSAVLDEAPTLHVPADRTAAQTPADPTLLTTKPAPDFRTRHVAAIDFKTRPATPFVESAPPETQPPPPSVRRNVATVAFIALAAAGLVAFFWGRNAENAAAGSGNVTTTTAAAENVSTTTQPAQSVQLSAPAAAVVPPSATTVSVPPAQREPEPARPARTAAAPSKQAPPVVVPPPAAAQPAPVSAPPAAAPQPAPQPPAATARVTPPRDRAAEIQALFRQVATAYQEKDVAFFRRRSLRFSDQMAAAIRNSPSIAVEIAVQNIALTSDDTARVIVRRTDRFAESRVPPAVQTLTYELRYDGTAWQIASVSRQVLEHRAPKTDDQPHNAVWIPTVTTELARTPVLLSGTTRLNRKARFSEICHFPPNAPSISERPIRR